MVVKIVRTLTKLFAPKARNTLFSKRRRRGSRGVLNGLYGSIRRLNLALSTLSR